MRLFRVISRAKSISAAFTAAGRSCWIQCPAPSIRSLRRRFGTTPSISCSARAPSEPVITASFVPAMNSAG